MCRFEYFLVCVVWIFTYDVWAAPVTIPCSYAASICGKPAVQPMIQRVVGGQIAPEGAWPWTVMLLNKGRQECAGAILGERLILTAAHCFEGPNSDPKRWTAMAGRYDIRRRNNNEMRLQVSSVHKHEDYSNTTLAHDIAVLVLAKPFLFSSVISAICLPPASQGIRTGQQCIFAGWGETRDHNINYKLRQVILPIISDDACSQVDWYGRDFIANTTFCAGYAEGGKDACSGDSGGPLVCKTDKRWYVQGVASWGYDCAEPKWPGIYSDVSMYVPWIQSKMEEQKLCSAAIVG